MKKTVKLLLALFFTVGLTARDIPPVIENNQEHAAPALMQNEVDARLLEAAAENNVAGINAALAAGADIDAQNAMGETALHKAALFGNDEAAMALLGAGADKTITDQHGLTPENCARIDGHEDLADIIKDYLIQQHNN